MNTKQRTSRLDAGQPLAGRVAIVTGASRGLGRAYAIALARAGAAVAINGRNADDLARVAAEIKGVGGHAVIVQGSVAVSEICRRLVEGTAERLGRVDILVNNAAVLRDHMVFNMTEEEWDEVIDVQLKATFLCTRFASPLMRQQGWGRVINMGSRAFHGAAGQSNNAAAKGGVIALTWTWALELSRYGITVNAVLPRAATELNQANIERALQAARQAGRNVTSPAEVGYPSPEWIAPLVVYLATEEAGWINGQVLGFNGRDIDIWSPMTSVRLDTRGEGWSLDDLRGRFKPLAPANLAPVPTLPGAGVRRKN